MSMSESEDKKLIKHLTKWVQKLQCVIHNVKERYEFRSCQLCDDLYDTNEDSHCPQCPYCSGCEQTVEQLYDNGNGDEWCGECIGHRHDMDDLMRDYRDSR